MSTTFIICLRADMPSPFPDNLRGLCSRCHAAIVYRPHIPHPSTLVCLECYPDLRAEIGDDVDHFITTATILELQAFTRRN